MATSDSIIRLQGTIGGLTFVNSRTYGDHVRARRGTFKKAGVNEAFKKESKILLRANVPAKIFKDAIDPYRRNLAGGLLWQRLVSLFRKQLIEEGSINFSNMEGFEIHADYPFCRFLRVQPAIKLNKRNSMLSVNIEYVNSPRFSKAKYIDGYILTLIVIFPDLKRRIAKTLSVRSDVMGLAGAASSLQTELELPPWAKSFIVCVKIEGCIKGVVSDARTTAGLRVIGSGMI